MSDMERLVRTWISGASRDEEIERIVSDISDDRATFKDIVLALGSYLTDEEDEPRSKGVELLSAVLDKCPSEKLSNQTVRVLTTFYCSKLEDHATVVPALQGLRTLTSLSNCLRNEAIAIIKSLFEHIKMKSMVQANRHMVFIIIDTVMARHRDALKNMNNEFLTGYTALAEGEKDPRNLLVAFAIAKVINIEFDITNHVEAMFNILFCYFPITYRPPAEDPYKITTEDLSNALRECFGSTPLFGPLAIPLFLEKLNAGSPTTKAETLKTLTFCIPIYGTALARASARKLWSSLKLEIFQPTDILAEQEALKTVSTLVRTLYDEDEPEQDLKGLAQDACEECIQILREPEKSMAKPAAKVLCAFMSTTAAVAQYTISQAIPHLIKLFLDPSESSARPAILRLMSDLINAARDASKSKKTAAGSSLMLYKDDLLSLSVGTLRLSASTCPALSVLKALVTTPSLCADKDLAFIVHSTNEIITSTSRESDLASDDAIDLLATISSLSSRHIKEQTLPLLFSLLPDQPPSSPEAQTQCWHVLNALSKLCLPADLFETFVIRLTTKLDLVCLADQTNAIGTTERRISYVYALLVTIEKTLHIKVEQKHPDVVKYLDGLVYQLCSLLVYSATSYKSEFTVSSDPRLVRISGKIITLVVQTLDPLQQKSFAANLFKAWVGGDIAAISREHHGLKDTGPFLPFDSDSAIIRNTIEIFAAGIIGLQKSVALPVPDINSFLDKLSCWAQLVVDAKHQNEAVWHIVSSVVNKHSDECLPFLQSALDTFWTSEVVNNSFTLPRRKLGLQLFFWVSKALLVQNHPLLPKFVDKFFEAFDDKNISWDAAKGLGDLAQLDDVLTKSHHSVLKLLYSQRFFATLYPRLIQGSTDQSKSTVQTEHLAALASLVKAVPRSSLDDKISTLLPLLLRGLELPDDHLRESIIGTLLSVAESAPATAIISQHVSTVVNIMLRNGSFQQQSSSTVRISAMKYMGLLPSLVRYDILQPHKATVVRELAKALDDPKRAVRKEAVDARTNWMKFSA